ncbi:MAG: hypothetical protein ABSE42_14835 [Bryobacteraceae bacterium]|jgi:hypothetical protein
MIPLRASAGADLSPEAAEVVRLIAKGNSKSAVEAAKLLYKRLGTPASEELLVDAYAARVRAMLEHRMTAEAEALVRLVRERHPACASRLEGLRDERIGAGSGLDELVRPLSDPAAAAEVRASIERTLRCSLADPAALAACAALAAEHPLRRAADAVARVFAAVTSGPVDDAALSLPEVSRRSPLAPWKFLVRAIASYYRHEDAACAEHLRAIDPESAPARLVPVLEVLLVPGDSKKLKPAAAALVAQAGGTFEALRRALQGIDAAFEEDVPKLIVGAVRTAAPLVQRQCPAILAEFRRRIAIMGMLQDISPSQVNTALGAMPAGDARFLMLQARALEMSGVPPLFASNVWELFRHAAIKEGWFPARGPEAAVLYLHMAELAAKIDPGDLSREHHDAAQAMHREVVEGFETGEPPLDHLHAEPLFERAAAMDPCAQVFERWTRWATQSGQPASAQAAAEAWRTAIPTDPRPLLHLMRMSEERSALKKALGYLRQAEELDGVNAEVRRARLRLLILGAVRHLKQRKPHLAEPELAELESLPQARENDRLAFVAALRYVAAFLAGDDKAAPAAFEKAGQILGHPLAARLALAAAGNLCEIQIGIRHEDAREGWIQAIPRVCEMGWDLGFTIRPPEESKQAILRELRTAGTAALERFGRTLIRLGWKDVAFAVSSAGLAAGKGAEGRFLLLRAMSYSEGAHRRQEDCLCAALALARLGGDSGLAAEAAEQWREVSLDTCWGADPPAMSQRQVQAVLKRERAAKRLPDKRDDPFGDAFDSPFDFDLPFPRRRRGRRARPDDGEEMLF